MKTRLFVPLATFALLASWPAPALAQGEYIGPGSTAEGDILRGQGLFLRGAGQYLQGAGQYNLYTAMAGSINADTFIRLNEYIYQSIQHENAERARRLGEKAARRVQNLNAIRDRILNEPEGGDIARGDAANSALRQLLRYNPSTYRSDSVPLDSELVRKIPFVSAEHNAVISLARINPNGRRWPIALNRREFVKECHDYERALDTVLDLRAERQTTRDAVLKLKETTKALEERLQQVEDHSKNPALFNDARNYILRLQKTAEDMQRLKIDEIYAAMDQYHGTSVHSLVQFMQKWNLQFGVPDLGEERGEYPLIRAAMKKQLDEVKSAIEDKGNEPQAER